MVEDLRKWQNLIDKHDSLVWKLERSKVSKPRTILLVWRLQALTLSEQIVIQSRSDCTLCYILALDWWSDTSLSLNSVCNLCCGLNASRFEDK